MSDEEVLLQSPLLYRLLRERSGALSLEVVVGGVAMSVVRVRLDAQEALTYAREGAPFIERLAQAVLVDPSFGGRSVSAP